MCYIDAVGILQGYDIIKFLLKNTPSSVHTIDNYGKDGGPHFTQCMIGICPLATHSYQNLQLQHKIMTTGTKAVGTLS